MIKLFVFLASTFALTGVAEPFGLRRFNIMDMIETQDESVQSASPEEWFENQKVDHTDPSNSKVWKQRFFTNDEYYGGAGYPVFVYLEGENVGHNGTVLAKGLLMNVLAKKHKALLVSLEHRYYGKSQPVADFTIANLQYLTAEQALNDLVHFQDHLTAKRKLLNSKWIAFGGSYPGMLAAWARLKHPDRILGSVASSGPILAKVDFKEFAEKVEFGLRYFGGDKCVVAMKISLVAFHKLVASTNPDDVAELNSRFKLCKNPSNDLERMTLEGWVYYPLEGTTQTNDFASYNLKAICEDFTKPGKTPLEKVADFVIKKIGSANCTDIDYDNQWLDSSLTSTKLSTTDVYRQWTYQTCAEFGFGQSSATSNSIFSTLSYINVDRAYGNICRQVFNITDYEARTTTTNKMYGGLKIDVSNVIFPTGNIDGWAGLALSNETGTVNPRSEVVDIDGISHCGDMGAPRPSDSGALVWAKQRIEIGVDRILRKQC